MEADLNEELEFHRASRQAALERDGLSPDEAARTARRALGNVTLAREDARDVWIWRSVERLWADVRYAVRSLRTQRTFCAVAVFTLAAGIGSTTAVFSVVEAELWKPLPFPDPDRLVSVFTRGTGSRQSNDIATVRDFLAWQFETDVFEGLGAFRPPTRHALRDRGTPESVIVRPVTSNFFSVLGRGAALGRMFGPSDEASGSAVILSDACWRRMFAADPSIVGTSIMIDDRPHVIVGVAAPDRLEIINESDLYSVIDLRPGEAARSRTRDLYVIGRLKPHQSVSNAEAAIRAILQRLAREYPSDYAGRIVRIQTIRDALIGYNWRTLYFFLSAAIFVLLLSCANVANLLLARALVRQREFAIRRALGGGRRALIQLLIAEGAVLATLGGVGGLLIAGWAIRLLPAWAPADFLDRGGPVVLDGRVFLFTLAITALTAILFGLVPLFSAGRDVQPLLGQHSRTTAGGIPQQQRARSALVVVEVMMALVLLFGAGLFLNSFIRLTQLPLGFEPQGRLTMQIPLAGGRYAEQGQIVSFADRLLEGARAVPGIQDAAVATSVPLGSGPSVRFAVVGRPKPSPGDELIANIRSVTAAYRRTLGIGLLAGRDLTSSDVAGAPGVALINENVARHLFPGESALGKQLEFLPSYASWVKPGTAQIVGILANSKEVGLNEIDFDAICVPLAQHPALAIQLVAHTSVPAAAVIDPLRRAVFTLDPSLAVYSIRTMTDRVVDASRGDQFNLALISAFAFVAMLMSAVGIYGAMSYSIEQRTREFGIRLALGAQPRGILAIALAQGTRLGVIGTVFGLALIFLLARLLGSALFLVPRQHEGLLYGVSLSDPLTLTCASAAVIAVAGLAGFVPARRATRIDPVIALRCE
jgi:putative ABC transport system permease protein